MRRREFLIRGAEGLASAGWLVLQLPHVRAADAAPATQDPGPWRVHAILDLAPDGRVTVRVAKSEMGQGVLTALPMLIAEELDVPRAQLHCELAPGALEYRDERGNQTTGYSSSVSSSFEPLRQLGAVARLMLLTAAARRWSRDPSVLRTHEGRVIDPQMQRSLPYADLIEEARHLTPPATATLKPRSEWRVLGREWPRADTAAKTDGTAIFGVDVRLPGMLFGVIERAPWSQARLVELDSAASKAVPGVVQVASLSTGVLVLARSFWAAQRGRERLKLRWSPVPSDNASTAAHAATLAAALTRSSGQLARGPAGVAVAAADDMDIQAEYTTPFLAHAALEPLSCTAQVTADRCDIWVGTQAPSRAQDWAARVTGLPRERVFVRTLPIGGAFGRRGEWDFVVEAVEAAQLAQRPVQILWTRADDMRHDYYRPMTANRIAGRLSAQGRWKSLSHDLAASSVARRRSPDMLKSGSDFLMTQGSSDLHYDLDDVTVRFREVELGVPVGFWRSVGHSHNGFVIESFVDELAHLAQRDPIEFRLAHLGTEPRMRGVLEHAAAAAGWSSRRPSGRALGIACMKAYGTYVAEVVEAVRVGSEVRIAHVWCAVDCGIVVNPAIVRQQMTSGIIYGLSAALQGAITHHQGRVEQSNFHDYPPLRMVDAPQVEVLITDSTDAPGGCGEPSTPVIAPAAANALFALTGQRQRSLPLRLTQG